MNIHKSKKIMVATLTIVMALTLALLPLPADERWGSSVEVTMADGSKVHGELLAVKTDALLIFDQNSGQGKRIDLQRVAQVKVLKKSRFVEGLLIGLVVGVGASFLNSHILKNGMSGHEGYYFGLGLFVFPPVAGLCGGLLGALAGIDKNISLAGTSSQNAQQNLKRLKRYAREKD